MARLIAERAPNYFLVTRRLVAAALPARDPAAVLPFNRGRLHAAALADGDTSWADANCGVAVVVSATVVTIVAIPVVVAVPADLNIDALGLDRSDERGSRKQRCGCRHGKSDLQHVEVLPGLDLAVQRARMPRVPPGQSREHGSSAAYCRLVRFQRDEARARTIPDSRSRNPRQNSRIAAAR